MATKEKTQAERDYASAQGLEFTRYYSSSKRLADSLEGMPQGWRHSYSKRLISTKMPNYRAPDFYYYNPLEAGWEPYNLTTPAPTDFAYIAQPDGYSIYFTTLDKGGTWSADSDVNYKLSTSLDSLGNVIQWRLVTPANDIETYDQLGRLVAIQFRSGQTQTLTYSDTTIQASIAPQPNLLIQVADNFGRTMQFQYDAQSRLVQMTDPAGQDYVYAYDANSNLISVTYPDGLKRQYLYAEPEYDPVANDAQYNHLLTGIADEAMSGNIVRYATFKYDGSGYPISTEHAGGVDKYTFDYTYNKITDPLGTVRKYGFTKINGVAVPTGISQPAGAGCAAAYNTIAYEFSNGNVSYRVDFNGNRTDYTFDLTRNLETSRIEGNYTAQARTISTQWHQTYRLPTRIAEPKKITTFTYDTSGNLLSKTEQATSDATGTQVFTAAAVGVPKVWGYTYNNMGKVLTETDPLNHVTSYSYDSQGNLATITNEVGHVTTLSDYDAHGRVGRITDPNGLTTDLTYNPRGWLISKSVGGDITSYVYNGTGKLIEVTLPDNSTIYYTYDDAHRLTGIADSRGNSITYTLDAMGNRIKEEVRDASGTLARQTMRVYDALNRLQQLTQSGSPAASVPMEPAQSDLASTVTWMTMTPSAPSLSQSITLQATVMGSTPTGTVTFNDGVTVLGTASITNGETASIVVPPLAGGAHTITATYSGDSRNKASASLPEQVCSC